MERQEGERKDFTRSSRRFSLAKKRGRYTQLPREGGGRGARIGSLTLKVKKKKEILPDKKKREHPSREEGGKGYPYHDQGSKKSDRVLASEYPKKGFLLRVISH